MKFLPYNPDQAYLLPPSVKDVLGENHLCFFLHHVVEELDLSGFEADYVEEGRAGYAPVLLLKVWLYAYALQVTSSRRLEQRVKEDLAFRYGRWVGAGPLDSERLPNAAPAGDQRSVSAGGGSGAGIGDGTTGDVPGFWYQGKRDSLHWHVRVFIRAAGAMVIDDGKRGPASAWRWTIARRRSCAGYSSCMRTDSASSRLPKS